MKFSMNVETLLKRFDFAYAAKLYRSVGFDAVDFPLCAMAINDKDVFNLDTYRETAAEMRRIAEAEGLTINQTHAPFQFSKNEWSDEGLLEEKVMPRMIRSLEISAILGAKIAVVHPIHHLVYAGHEEELFELNMKYYRRLLPYAKEYGVQIGVENMFQRDPRRKCLSADTCSFSAEFIRYIDTLDDPFAVGCLDVGHVGLPANATEEAEDVIRALGHDRLKALHLHDNDYCNDLHLPPYLGKLNWMEIARALGEIDYTGDFTYEIGSARFAAYDEGFLPIMARFMADTGRHLMAEVERNRKKA